jgi:hypothetical protein
LRKEEEILVASFHSNMDSTPTRCSDSEYETRKKLLETIKLFSRSEQEEVFRILKRNSEEVSENRNGLFFDIAMLKQKTADELYGWSSFCVQNNKLFSERSKVLEELSGGSVVAAGGVKTA